MKKNDLKRMLKPLIKECVKEMILEEGLLTNIVSEVAAGMQGNLVTESRQVQTKRKQQTVDEKQNIKRKSDKARKKINEHRQRLMDSIGKDAYGGVDLFEGTEPIKPQATNVAGSVDLGDPNDSGVDINSILGNASNIWKAIK
jgi:hypothetical protein